MKTFVVDVSRCNGCHNCQIVCKDEHVGNDWTPIAKPQPDTGQFWMKLTEHDRATLLYPCSVYGGMRDVFNATVQPGSIKPL